MSNTSLSDLRVYEAGAGPASEPILKAGDVQLDVGAVGAARGMDPTEIHFRDAQVLLRFDRNGDLLTRLPRAGDGGGLPAIHIESGTLTIRQVGHEDSVFQGIDLTITEVDHLVKVSGKVEDRAWGEWTAEGAIPTGGETKAGKLTLTTVKPQQVTPELLRHVPFVNPNAWTHVGLAGTTPATLELSYDAETEKVGYRVSLEPTQTTVDVPSIGLHVTDAAGGLAAEGSVVTLSDVRGKAAGEVRLDSRMDFAGATDVLRFMADLHGLDVRQLPRQWKLPPGLDGRLTGKVEFVVTLPAGGGTQVEAVGRATIAQARLQGRKIPDVELNVTSGPGGGLDFSERPADRARHEVKKPDETKLDDAAAAGQGRRPAAGDRVGHPQTGRPGGQAGQRRPRGEGVPARQRRLPGRGPGRAAQDRRGRGTGQGRREGDGPGPGGHPDRDARRVQGVPADRDRPVEAGHGGRTGRRGRVRPGGLPGRQAVGQGVRRQAAGVRHAGRGGRVVPGPRGAGRRQGYPFKATVKLDKVPLESVEQLRSPAAGVVAAGRGGERPRQPGGHAEPRRL